MALFEEEEKLDAIDKKSSDEDDFYEEGYTIKGNRGSRLRNQEKVAKYAKAKKSNREG